MIWLSVLSLLVALGTLLWALRRDPAARFDAFVDRREVERQVNSHSERLGALDERLDAIEEMLGGQLGIKR